jgi:thiamine-phosphate pyrophosphorylase
MKASRIIDANINRSAEGLRVLEDIARFEFDHKKISSRLRDARHKVRDIFKDRESDLLGSRDSVFDVGIKTSKESTSDGRFGLKDSVLSNFKRVQEAFRSMEEAAKTDGEYEKGKSIETLRFLAYSIEPEMVALFRKTLPRGIYGILGEKFSRGRANVEVAKRMATAGIDLIQYREKLAHKSIRDIYDECLEIRKITKDAGIPFIVNDYADIALMVGADGIHTGQDDLPVKALRQIVKDMVIGRSTHSPSQAQKAVEDGADYIGVGPIFSTQTKEDVCDPVGFEYLDHVVNTHTIPFVAIGGIKRHNLEAVLSRGAKTICLVTEIIGAENIETRINEIKEIMERF